MDGLGSMRTRISGSILLFLNMRRCAWHGAAKTRFNLVPTCHRKSQILAIRPIPAWQCELHSARKAAQWGAASSLFPPPVAREAAPLASTRISGRRTAPFPPSLIPNRVPRGSTQDPSTDHRRLAGALVRQDGGGRVGERVGHHRADRRGPAQLHPGPSRARSASRSSRRALLMPRVNPGSLYRCGKRT